jgi:hypothetical protein
VAEKSGFFNSSSGDRVYDATDFAAYFGDLVSNGVFHRNADNLRVVAASGMQIMVQPGSAWINGYHYQNTTPLDLPISTADGVNPRIDRVILRWSNVGRSISLAVISGTPAPAPNPPNLTRNADIWELGIATVYILRGALSINAENISDTRMSATVCGLVNSLVSAVYE